MAARDESGQSILEFLLMLPMMVGLILIMVRVNSAIQVSIVNQQYARAQAHWLAFNSPVYPERRLVDRDFVPNQTNRMVIGVSENNASGGGDVTYVPEASTQLVVRSKAQAGPDSSAGEDLTERALVRVRTTVALCTQTNAVRSQTGYGPLTSKNLFENSRFDFCKEGS